MIKIARRTQQAPPKAQKRRVPQDANEWIEEGARAEQARDWPRAVVCYRRAVEGAPFCSIARQRFEDALTRGILADFPDGNVAGDRVFFTGEDDGEEFEEFAEPEAPVAAPRRKKSKVELLDEPRTRWLPFNLGGGFMPIAAIGFAVLLTFGGLAAAVAMGGWLRGVFTSDDLPAVAMAKLPSALSGDIARANMLLVEKKPAEAADVLREAVAEFPEYKKEIAPALAMALRAEGAAERRAARYENAAAIFREATAIDSSNEMNYIDLAGALHEQARTSAMAARPGERRPLLSDAEQALKAALARKPGDREALLLLAKVYDAIPDRAQAERTYKQVLDGDADSPEGRQAQVALQSLKRR